MGAPRAARARISVDEMASMGISIKWSRSLGPGSRSASLARSEPGRVAAMNSARASTSSRSFQVRMCSTASAPVMKYSRVWSPSSARSRQGVDGVGRPWVVDLGAADRERGIGCGGDQGHLVAVLGWAHAHGLLPGLARGDEQHLVQLELPAGLFGGHQMAVVDGVEGAAHEADPSLPAHGVAV